MHAPDANYGTEVAEHNTMRPHQSLDMATPARPLRRAPADGLSSRLPVQLAIPSAAGESVLREVEPVGEGVLGSPDAVEVDRVVPRSGNLVAAGQQFRFGPKHAGRPVTLWMDSTTVHVSPDGRRIKTVPSRLSTAPPPAGRLAGSRPRRSRPSGGPTSAMPSSARRPQGLRPGLTEMRCGFGVLPG